MLESLTRLLVTRSCGEYALVANVYFLWLSPWLQQKSYHAPKERDSRKATEWEHQSLTRDYSRVVTHSLPGLLQNLSS